MLNTYQIMANVICQKKGNGMFYYIVHQSGGRSMKRYLGKTIPKDIEERKRTLEREFFCREWNIKTKAIVRNYRKENARVEESIKLKNFESFGIVFTYNTQRIEGSTLSRADTNDLLVHGITPARKSNIDTIETKRHYDLFMEIATARKPSKITVEEVQRWHTEIFGQTKIGEAGTFRRHTVEVITNPKIEFATPLEIPRRIKKFFEWMDNEELRNPVEFAALAHYTFVSIHPFADGNGRISRMIVNCLLLKHGCPLMLIENRDKRSYFGALEKSQLNDDEMFFVKWFMKYYIKKNKRYL